MHPGEHLPINYTRENHRDGDDIFNMFMDKLGSAFLFMNPSEFL